MGKLATLKSIVTFGAYDDLRPSETHALAATAAEPLMVGQPIYQQGDMNQTVRANWPRWDPSAAQRDGYARVALIYRCVNLIAHSVGTAPIRIYDESQDNATIPDHPMRKLMRRPNPFMGEAAFHGMVALKAAVNGFCVIEKERDLAGNVIGLWPLQSTWLKAIKRMDGSNDWQYRVPGIVEPFMLKAENVIPFRWAETPDGSPYGLGPLQACLREISLSSTMSDFIKAMFESGAMPTYGIIPDPQARILDQVQIETLIDQFLERHGGLSKAARPIYMQAIKDIKPLSFDLNQLAYQDLRDLSELAIAQAFGIPATIVQLRVGLQHSQARANATADETKFYRQCIIPFWSRYDDCLTLNLLDEFEPSDSPISMEFDTSDITFLQDDRAAKAAWLNAAMTGGWLSAHSWHRELGFVEPDGDDYYLRPNTVTPVPVTDPLMVVAPPVPPPNPNPPPALARLSPPLMLRATTQAAGYQGRLAKAKDARMRIALVAEARAPRIARFFKAQGQRVVPKVMEGLAAADRMVTFGTDSATPEQTNASAAFRKRYAMESVDWADEDARLKEELTKLYLVAGTEAFDAAVTDYGLTVGISFDLANANVKNVVDKLATRVTEIGNETRTQIADAVSQGLQDGKSIKDIAQSLTGMFEETYANRAETIARTESMVSYGEASVLGFTQSGQVDRAQIFDNAAHTQEYGASDGLSCAQRDGLVCPLNEAMDHIYADHPNGSAVAAPILTGEVVE